MCLLDKQKGLKIGKTYTNGIQARNFVGYTAKAQREKIRKEVEESPFISVMSDGATDSAVMEQEIIYVRFTHKGVPKVRFVGVATVEKADADHIFKGLKAVTGDVLSENWSEKLVAVGSDRA
ncbi:hypothetical protein BaRGS_00000309 [Batillaria attramentaria]|uniref:Uncharacterized protein n=1 Tax=Batillaria attramentaria TaxID=370345 RepID=A0ABD0MDQ3_9CAEN